MASVKYLLISKLEGEFKPPYHTKGMSGGKGALVIRNFHSILLGVVAHIS
jgi:hypothetical protein